MTTKIRAVTVAASAALVAGAAVAIADAPSNAVPKGTSSTAATVTEGQLATATVTLKKPAKKSLIVHWKTLPGTAKKKDFTKVKGGQLIFSKGQLAATVAVRTKDDKKVEPTEYFWVKFSGNNVKIKKKKVKISIADNDGTTTSPTATPSGSATSSPTGSSSSSSSASASASTSAPVS